MRAPAPIYVDAMALCAWLTEHAGSDPLSRRLCEIAMDLLGAIALAVSGRDRDRQIEIADEHLIVLRTLLTLAEETGRLTEGQYLHLQPRIQAIGRQLGGWRRALGAV